MTRPNITPGPWYNHRKDSTVDFFTDKWKPFHSFIAGEGFQPAAIFNDGEINRGIAEANAQAIAAVPDLLAALEDTTKALEALWQITTKGMPNETLDAAKAALTKAGYTL
jgi:hypothetical protein